MYIVGQATQLDGEEIVTSSFPFNTEKAARSNWHSFLASCYANDNLVYFMGSIQDSAGHHVVDPESYFRPQAAEE